MRLVDIDKCNRELFYKEIGGKDVLITAETAFDMVEALYNENDPDIQTLLKIYAEKDTLLN